MKKRFDGEGVVVYNDLPPRNKRRGGLRRQSKTKLSPIFGVQSRLKSDA